MQPLGYETPEDIEAKKQGMVARLTAMVTPHIPEGYTVTFEPSTPQSAAFVIKKGNRTARVTYNAKTERFDHYVSYHNIPKWGAVKSTKKAVEKVCHEIACYLELDIHNDKSKNTEKINQQALKDQFGADLEKFIIQYPTFSTFHGIDFIKVNEALGTVSMKFSRSMSKESAHKILAILAEDPKFMNGYRPQI